MQFAIKQDLNIIIKQEENIEGRKNNPNIKKMKNYDELIELAKINKWCVSSSCTTCRCIEFRNAVKQMQYFNREEFMHSIKNTKFGKHGNFYFVESTIQLFRELKNKEKIVILEYWINRKDISSNLLDYIFFYIAKYYLNNNIGQIWLKKCIDIAVKEKNISLTESLILSLKEGSKNYTKLTNLISELNFKSNIIEKLNIKYKITEDTSLKN